MSIRAVATAALVTRAFTSSDWPRVTDAALTVAPSANEGSCGAAVALAEGAADGADVAGPGDAVGTAGLMTPTPVADIDPYSAFQLFVYAERLTPYVPGVVADDTVHGTVNERDTPEAKLCLSNHFWKTTLEPPGA